MPDPAPQLLFPASTEWESWPLPDGNAASASYTEPGNFEGTAGATIALPTRHFLCLSAVLPTDDTSLIPDMMALQAEKFTLGTPDASEPISLLGTIPRRDGRTLAVATYLTDAVPPELALEQAGAFTVAYRCIAFAENSLTFYRETGTLTLVITSGNRPVFFQSLAEAAVDADLIQEIHCLILQLQSEGVITSLEQVIFRLPVDEQILQAFSDVLQLPASVQEPPRPSLASIHEVSLIPPAVIIARRARVSATTRRRIALAAAAVYFLLAAVLAGQYFWLRTQVGSLQTEIAQDEDQVAEIQKTARRWTAIEPSINPEIYPIERLYQASRLLPEDGLRLVIFEQRGNDFLISGEAGSPSLAVKFNEDLKNSPDWAGFNWTMPMPRTLPNNSAQFQITGRRTVAGPVLDEADSI